MSIQLALSIFVLACILAAWSSYITLNLLPKILTYKGNPPVPPRYALDELKFSCSIEEA